ncbi:MAG: FAD:protein FMN transferase, partial [Desulfobacterales bacterium]
SATFSGVVFVFYLVPWAVCLPVSAIMKKYKYIVISIFFLFMSTSVEAKQEHLIQGRTMGTTYQVKVVTGRSQSISGLKEKLEARLEEINQSMSTYKEDSEISRFNDSQLVDNPFKISNDFYQVMKIAQTIYQLSEGAWDGTVNPLVDLWGFGRAGRKTTIPQQKEISGLLPDIGFKNIEIAASGYLVKKRPTVTLDLSSIAKGYGVDQLADVIRKEGYQNYLVEIGGEVFASGYRKDGKPWRIGINRPQIDAAFDDVYKVVDLHNKAFATSGDYRNFFVVDGMRYSHIIDPRTGYPVSNGVVSATIISETCTFADGLATAIMVMGADKGLELVNRIDGTEGLIIIEKQDGGLVPHHSKGFEVDPQR